MNEPGKAVFLSYASQDAEVAKRICDALRAAGVEVWFDQSELRGGDSWDAMIRKRIKECVLFVPVITANTNARPEGYFRLEWKLAVDRSHLLADDHPFLFPIVIGDVQDATARVPDKFREVQWTRLRLDETPAELGARVARLLSGSVEPGRPRPGERGEGAASPGSNRSARWQWWMIFPILGTIMGLMFAAVPMWKALQGSPAKRSPQVQTPDPKSQAPILSEARKLANQAMQLLMDPDFTRETSWLADELCQRALALDAGDAEVWAVASFASHNLYSNTYDRSANRREKARSQAARASQLDPQSVRAAIAVARCLESTDNNGEVLRILRELHRRAPTDQQVIFSLLRAERAEGNESAVQELLRELRALPRTGVLPLALWFEELQLRTLGRYAEAEVILDELLAWPVVPRGAYYEKLNLLMRSWHDLAEAGPFIEKIPARFRQEPAFGSAIAYYHLWRREPELALKALDQVPQDYFEEYAAREPKALLTGWAHAVAGRPAAAQAEWRTALALVDDRLKSDGRNFTLMGQRALLLALTGQAAAAREAWQLRVELGGEERPTFDLEGQVFMALGEPEAALTALERGWAQLKPGIKGRTLPALRYHPAFAPLQAAPRMQRLLADGAATLTALQAQPTGTPGPIAPPADAKSVAVLAFANLSDDKANEYFSDGISEELLNVLAKIPGLKVSARTSAFYFKGKHTPIPEIAKQLGVAYVIEGSVRKQGDKVRITAQLIKAADGFHVWSETFTRDLKDIFAVQDEIAGLVAGKLSLKLGVETFVAARTVDPEAYRLMLLGRAYLDRATQADVKQAKQYLQEALERDPKLAIAWAWLSIAYWSEAGNGWGPAAPGFAAARAAAERAVALDPDLFQAHNALGFVYYGYDWDWRRARDSFERAAALAPGQATVLSNLARLATTTGAGDQAVQLGRRAVELDPLSSYAQYSLCMSLFQAGRFAELEAQVPQLLQLSRNGIKQQVFSLLMLRRNEEASQVAGLADGANGKFLVSLASWACGRTAEADASLAQLKATAADTAAYQIAQLYAQRGEGEEAFAWLETSFRQRDTGMIWLKTDPLLRGLHGDARWEPLLRKMGLTDDQLK